MDDLARTSVCTLCSAALTVESKFCHQCGKSVDSPPQASAAPHPKWYYNVWLVLFMLFFVLGPFGLPLVWKNPRFGRWVKIALTLAMVVYTIALLQLTITMVRAVLKGVEQFNATLQF